METYTDFGVSYLIQSFVSKANRKLWNDCWVYLTDDFYYKVEQNRAILATHDSLLDHWLSHRNIWKIKCFKTFKTMIHYNKYHSIFNIYSTHSKERIIHSTIAISFFFILLLRNLCTDLLFSTYKLTGDHKCRERRYISYTYKLNTYKLNNCLNLNQD